MNKLAINNIKDVDPSDIFDYIYNSSTGKELIKNLSLNEQEIIKNAPAILNYINNLSMCGHCKSLKECKKNAAGYIYTLKRDEDNNIIEYLAPCKHQVKIERLYNNIIFSTYSIESFLVEKPLEFIQKNMYYLKTIAQTILDLNKGIPTLGCYCNIDDVLLRKKSVINVTRIMTNKYKCSVIQMVPFLKELKKNFNNNEGLTELLAKIENSPILIIDDLGSENISSWSRDEILSNILDYRIENSLPTIIFSDYKLEQLQLLYTVQKDSLKAENFVKKVQCIVNK